MSVYQIVKRLNGSYNAYITIEDGVETYTNLKTEEEAVKKLMKAAKLTTGEKVSRCCIQYGYEIPVRRVEVLWGPKPGPVRAL